MPKSCKQRLVASLDKEHAIVLCQWESGEWTGEIWGSHPLAIPGYWDNQAAAKAGVCTAASTHLMEVGIAVGCPEELKWRQAPGTQRRRRLSA